MDLRRPGTLVPLCLAALVACKGNESASPPAADPTQAAADPAAPPADPAPTAAAAEGCQELRKSSMAECEKACEAGRAKACTFAGYLHQEEDDEAVADVNAIRFFQKACDEGDASGCHEVAVYHRNGLGGLAKDPAKAKEYYVKTTSMFEKECEAGDRRACFQAAGYFQTAVATDGAVQVDAAKALALYKKSCELGSDGGCAKVKEIEGGAP